MNTDINTHDWLHRSQSERPIIIAGPCSAETEQQVMEAAESLRGMGISYFRAGAWKPRTRPNNFEGVGDIALKWLSRARMETGLKVCTEVANGDHVRKALENKIDLIWIGARTAGNPFSVQEIASELKGVDVEVLVKNPISPDIELWIGALERIYNSGITKLGAIHRGFSIYGKTTYRNPPLWDIPIELKRLAPTIPIIVDPSHISGTKRGLARIIQGALELRLDGLMIEVHPFPENALSDSKQQISPAALEKLLGETLIEDNNNKTLEPMPDAKDILDSLRKKIDRADDRLMGALSERMSLVSDIGRLKKKWGLPVIQNSRWKHLLESVVALGKEKDLSIELIEKIYVLIHKESINMQSLIMNKE